MKKLVLVLALLSGAFANGAVLDGLAAKVNSDVITFGDVLTEIRRNPEAGREFAQAANDREALKRLYRRAVEAMIERRLILNAAADKKMDMQEWVVDNRVREIVKDNFKGDRNLLEAALQKTKTPFDEWRNIIREDLIIAGMRYQMIDKYIQPTPGAMRKEYEENRSRYRRDAQTTVKVILLKPASGANEPAVKDRADKILKALDAGTADFGALAREYSADSHAKDGGVWKDINPAEAFRPEIAEAIAKLKVGEYSRLVNLDGWGFIVHKDAETPAKVLCFSEAYDLVTRNVRQKEAALAYSQWLKRLRAQSFIKVYLMPEE